MYISFADKTASIPEPTMITSEWLGSSHPVSNLLLHKHNCKHNVALPSLNTSADVREGSQYNSYSVIYYNSSRLQGPVRMDGNLNTSLRRG